MTGKFGWSYPPGAATDPSAPYNQPDTPVFTCDDCGTDHPITECRDVEVTYPEGHTMLEQHCPECGLKLGERLIGRSRRGR